MAFELRPGEEILQDVGANLKRGIEWAGGRLRITNQRLLFEAHLLNLQSQVAEIPLRNIRHVHKDSVLLGLRSIVVVEVENGPIYQFVVNNVPQVIDLIEQQRLVAASTPPDKPGEDSRRDIGTEMEKLHDLFQNGAITEEEFKEAKSKLLE